MNEKNSGRNLLKKLLSEILGKHAKTRVNGNVASHSTAATQGTNLHTCFNDLWRIGCRIADPKNLTQSHVRKLCEHWHTKRIATSTMQARLSSLRIFCGWIGKGDMVKSLPEYLPGVESKLLRVVKTAQDSKSWTENGIDVIEKIKLADALDVVFGRMLRMDLAFGLRRMEVLQMKPHKSDMGNKLRVYEAKNGRQRDIDIEIQEQRQVLDLVKAATKGKLDYLGWKHTTRGKVATMDYNIARYNKCMAKIGITRKDAGVTGHGLRAQYAENAALIADMIPPTLGGTGGQMEKGELDIKRAQISEKLGHSRISITGAYYGSFGRNVTEDTADRCKLNIEKALEYCHTGVTKILSPDRMDDCLQMVKELMAINVDITPRQVQILWEIHSEKFAVYWKTPQAGNAAALEAAALKLIKQETARRKLG
jgi:integrase